MKSFCFSAVVFVAVLTILLAVTVVMYDESSEPEKAIDNDTGDGEL